jgi:5-methylcytosine-specific restriction endonuclease McrA
VLRYAVLKRDRFRCVLCGASPATDPACELELDHIRPYSKGGQTVLANLRTLCRRCNQGRSNRHRA